MTRNYRPSKIRFNEYPGVCLIDLSGGALPLPPIPFLCQDKKGIKKGQGCDPFARKTNVQLLPESSG